ncbi:MAG: MBL fold metallo-hydrolase [Rhizomicrobium sp.]|jgi:phosphoribosyl 1,2-cyclic phosphate phosphodiesterase
MSAVLEVTILGSGSSTGVPRIGGADGTGDWGACDPANPKNRRRRCSILVRRKDVGGETSILVDTSPDLREQLLSARVTRLDAALITHDHADQLHGIDDLRTVAYLMRKRIDVYTDRRTMDTVYRRFGYCFETPEGSGYPPILTANVIAEPFRDFAVEGPGGTITVSTFWQQHGQVRSLGFRFGPLAYSSDVNALDEAAFAALEGVHCWIVDALRHAPHPTHANVATALCWIARIRPRRSVLTNLHLDLDYDALKRELPDRVEPAYDGMTIDVSL